MRLIWDNSPRLVFNFAKYSNSFSGRTKIDTQWTPVPTALTKRLQKTKKEKKREKEKNTIPNISGSSTFSESMVQFLLGRIFQWVSRFWKKFLHRRRISLLGLFLRYKFPWRYFFRERCPVHFFRSSFTVDNSRESEVQLSMKLVF